MKKVAGNQRPLRRNSVYYYRRRVPLHLVKEIGEQFVQHSLNTTSLATAKKLRALRDLEWDARFEDLQKDAAPGSKSAKSKPTMNSTPLSDGDLLRLVREYVERKDDEFRKRFANTPPESERERHAVIGRTLGIKVASAEIFLRSGVYSSTNLLAAARLADLRRHRSP
jgi:hypothetical protein